MLRQSSPPQAIVSASYFQSLISPSNHQPNGETLNDSNNTSVQETHGRSDYFCPNTEAFFNANYFQSHISSSNHQPNGETLNDTNNSSVEENHGRSDYFCPNAKAVEPHHSDTDRRTDNFSIYYEAY
jgi:hypothetical protein